MPDTIMFHEPNGTQYDAALIRGECARGPQGQLDVRIVFEVPWAIYERIDLLEMFHLYPAVRGESAGGGLEVDVDVRIEARLDRDLADEHFASADEAAVVDRLVALTGDDPDHLLLETESWFGLYVTQAVELPPGMPGELREGYQTTWTESETVDRTDTAM